MNYGQGPYQSGFHSNCPAPSVKNPARHDEKCVLLESQGSRLNIFENIVGNLLRPTLSQNETEKSWPGGSAYKRA